MTPYAFATDDVMINTSLTTLSSSSNRSDEDEDTRQVITVVAETTVVTVISVCIVVTNVINLAVLSALKTAMPWATTFFLINLSLSDLLVGVIACTPAVIPAITGRWIYGTTWCQVSGVMHGTSVTISIWSISMVGLYRYVATTLPLRYRKLVARSWRHYAVVAGLWGAALATFIAPLFTKSDFLYYRFNKSQKMCGLHWEYPTFCVITGLYIPVLSGGILIFTGIRIKSTLSSRTPVGVQQQQLSTLQHSDNLPLGDVEDGDGDTGGSIQAQSISPAATVATSLGGVVYRRRLNYGSRRTLRILVSTGIAYFICWGPYVTTVFVQSFAPSVRPPAPIEFLLMWLANANSGVNVFIYSSTNLAFRRQCIAIMRRCCGRSGRLTV